MSLSSLDDWLEKPSIRTHHRRSAAAPDDELWRAAQELRLDETRALGPLVRWRIPGTPAGQTFGKLFRTYPFTVLEEGERMLVSGLCGRIWTLARDYPALDGGGEFRDWDESGTVRVIFAHWAAPLTDGTAELVSEARVQPVDRGAARRLRALWAVVGPFERLVGAEALTAAVRRAEDGGPAPTPRRAPDRPAARRRR
jgi:hypothetical protein